MLFCNKEDCIYRSKKQSNYTAGGKPLYKCKAKHTIIDCFADGCSDTYMASNNSCMCRNYRERGE